FAGKFPNGRHRNVDILLFRNASDIKQSELSRLLSVFLKKGRISVSGSKQRGVNSTRKKLQPFRGYTALDPALSIVFRIHVNHVKLGVKPLHITPSQGL